MTRAERQALTDDFQRMALREVEQGHGCELCLARWLARWATLFDPPLPYPMPPLPGKRAE